MGSKPGELEAEIRIPGTGITGEESQKEQRFQAQKLESMANLAARIAHDFNNILQSVLGYAQLARMGKNPEHPDYKTLLRIEEVTNRGRDLSKRLLTVGQKFPAKPVPINLNDKINKMRTLLLASTPGVIAIECELQEDIRTTNADEEQIEQVLLHLADNARDAMPDGGRLLFRTENVHLGKDHPLARVHAVEGDYVCLSVCDTGCGMSEETLMHIFEPFYTGKKEKKGAGLGLSAVYALVTCHGGFIDCTSKIGEGSAFHLYFPTADIGMANGSRHTAQG